MVRAMDKKRIKEELFREYEVKRVNALEKKNIETMMAYDKSPELEKIDAEINKLGLSGMRDILNKVTTNKDFNKSMKELIKKRDKIIKENKINPDYNKPFYECSLCNDTGYDENNELCECFTKRLTEIDYENSKLGKMLADAEFENFSLDYYDDKETIKEIKDEAVRFCEKFDDINYNLFFYGHTGLGKTFLSSIIAKNLLDKGKNSNI